VIINTFIRCLWCWDNLTDLTDHNGKQ